MDPELYKLIQEAVNNGITNTQIVSGVIALFAAGFGAGALASALSWTAQKPQGTFAASGPMSSLPNMVLVLWPDIQSVKTGG